MGNVGRSVKCPRCDEWRLPLQERCPECGLDLTVLRSLDDLRNAVQQAQSDSEVVANRLRELQRQVISLEPQIVTQLTSSPAAPPPKQPSPEVEETAPPVGSAAPVTSEAAAEVDTAPPPGSEWTAEVAPPAAKRSPVLSGTAEVRLGQKWLLIAGLVITVLAVGYFLKYSFDRNWIGPAGRVSLATWPASPCWASANTSAAGSSSFLACTYSAEESQYSTSQATPHFKYTTSSDSCPLSA